MNVSTPSSGAALKAIDFAVYLRDQFPQDLAQMLALRDELEIRQGAMSAVEETNTLKMQASELLAKAKQDAKVIADEAAEKLAAANTALVELNSRDAALNERETAVQKREADASAKEKALQLKAEAQDQMYADQQQIMDKQAAIFAADRAAFDKAVAEFNGKLKALGFAA